MSGRGADPKPIVEQLLRDPPVVHAMDLSDDPALGVWSTDADCYRFLAATVAAGSRTLETGAGLSTALLAALGAVHTCVTPSQAEADRITAYCARRGIATGGLSFVIGRSDEVLPSLQGELDLVLIDGNHGYPTPIIDWYYAAGRLRAGGVLIVDDTQLPAVAHLMAIVARDPRWSLVRRSRKWVSWRRQDQGPLVQDWFDQPWLRAPLPTDPVGLARRGWGYLRRRARLSP